MSSASTIFPAAPDRRRLLLGKPSPNAGQVAGVGWISRFKEIQRCAPSTQPALDLVDEAHVAAAAFLARYSGRTLDAYRDDLRYFFQWAADTGLEVLAATRPHIETYRFAVEERGLAPSTIDRRLSTVCGFYRFAHIDGRIDSNPAQYVRRPQVYPSTARGMDRSELGVFLFTAERYDRPHAALACSSGSTASGSAKRAAPTSKTSASNDVTALCRSSARATSPPPSLSCHARPAHRPRHR